MEFGPIFKSIAVALTSVCSTAALRTPGAITGLSVSVYGTEQKSMCILVAGSGIASETRAYETLEILLLQPAIVYLKNFLTIHLIQIYLTDLGNKSPKSKGSGISLGVLPYARFKVSLLDIPFSFQYLTWYHMWQVRNSSRAVPLLQ